MASNPDLPSAPPGSSDSIDTQEELYDFGIVKKAVGTLTSDIVTVLHPELGSVLDQAKGMGLIGQEMYGQYKEGSDSKKVARNFLEIAVAQCSMDHSKLKMFFQIFDVTPSLEIISKKIQQEMRRLEKLALEPKDNAVSVPSDSFTQPQQPCPRQSSTRSSEGSLKSMKSDDFDSAGIQEQSSNSSFKYAAFRNFPNAEENTEEHGILDSASMPVAEPEEVFARGRQVFRNVRDKVQMKIKTTNNTYQQVKEALPQGDSAQMTPNLKEVSEKLALGMQVTGKYYDTYMTITQNKQIEIDELEKKYDREFQELKKKHETKAEEVSKSEQVKEEKDLKSKYSKDAMKFAEDGQLLEDQVTLQSETSSVEILQVKIEYEKKINELSSKLNHEIHSLKDEIASLKDTITELKLREKEKEAEQLRLKLREAETKIKAMEDENILK